MEVKVAFGVVVVEEEAIRCLKFNLFLKHKHRRRMHTREVNCAY
jgi:hypothetical protein